MARIQTLSLFQSLGGDDWFVNRYISRLLGFIVLRVILLLSWFLPVFLNEWVLFFRWTKWKRMLSRLMRAQDQSIL